MEKFDPSMYVGREQAYVKHFLLKNYVSKLAYKVSSRWDSLVYIDGFSGPWGVTDESCADSSFGVAFNELRKVQERLRDIKGVGFPMEMILVEKEPTAFEQLKHFANFNSTDELRIYAFRGDFVNEIPRINQEIKSRYKKPFRFILLDPKGWVDIPMPQLQTFINDRSCEVLINLMTAFIVRFLGKPELHESYLNLFGRAGVIERLRALSVKDWTQAEEAVREYCRSLTELCNFKHVSSAAVLEPGKEAVRYFLVYATNSVHGIEVFKEAETAAANIQNEIRYEKRLRESGQGEMMFDDVTPKSSVIYKLRDHFIVKAKQRVKSILLNSDPRSGVPYKDLFCAAMEFPLVTPDDLRGWLSTWEPWVRLNLPDSTKRKVPSPTSADRVFIQSGIADLRG